MAVHDDTLLWLSKDSAGIGSCLFQLSIEQALEGDLASLPVPEMLKGNNRFLCLIPDHWMGMESYPFQSPKASLIEAFLKRKLSASQPGQKSIAQFFNYQRIPVGEGQDTLYAHFLQEDTAYRLNRNLCKANLAPRGYTTSAFLWEATLSKASPSFTNKGSLLVHISGGQGFLYFYFNGIYHFSRVVVLPDDETERIGAITYEINQSLYLFSQKTKSELRQIYLYPHAPPLKQALSETLGREIMDCKALESENHCGPDFFGMPALCGMLISPTTGRRGSVFSVVHRQVKRNLAWRPVRWMGMAVGVIMVLLLAGEAVWLDGKRQKTELDQRHLQRQMRTTAETGLTGYSQALAQVLHRIQQPSCFETVRLAAAALPVNARLKALDMTLASPATLEVSALVDARDMADLRATLGEVVAAMKTSFKKNPDLSIKDIEVGPSVQEGPSSSSRYAITFQMEL